MTSPCSTVFRAWGGMPHVVQHGSSLTSAASVVPQGAFPCRGFSSPRTSPCWPLFPPGQPGLLTCGSGLHGHKRGSCQAFVTPRLRGPKWNSLHITLAKAVPGLAQIQCGKGKDSASRGRMTHMGRGRLMTGIFGDQLTHNILFHVFPYHAVLFRSTVFSVCRDFF